ncbi:TetR/AcrR family transcriptional regulator [Puniceibacterium sp. IMCC21224]|uniref:TetR/AcrR family transcriptional regulator n=1 Tax=Puniceibacterium sp. IMCC21224 TaxID=1618204 RepID=UPI00065D2558|nr:TetR/AcrR family transcriptional regulator [Puniceibacterium sp. IMCC21224]KMK65066.1 transcriptional regulator, TetR family [Puniceibacterium sp. IMCC21224]
MSRAQPTTDAAAAAREEILQAAAELFTDLGYAMTSIDAIAERLGATKGRVYYYFKSKADIFFDIQRAAMGRLMAEVEPIARSDLGPADKLRGMAAAHLGMLLADLPIQKVSVQGLERYLFHSSGYRYVNELREINQLRDTYEQIFAEVIDQGAREGLFNDMPPAF